MELSELIKQARAMDCSDLHITAGTEIAVRRYGELKILDAEDDYKPTLLEAEAMILSMLSDEQKDQVLHGNDLDLGLMAEDGTRIRANVYHQRNHLAASIRLLSSEIPSIEELGLPRSVLKMSEERNGLVLVTGPTGCGKSTTLASMVEHINATRESHIITIEDPIEYVYGHKKALIHQREVGKDIDNFANALRSALREDPDIILVGEMRDFETISAAIAAAETGHLVLATLHTSSAAQTVERIIDGCPLDAQNRIRVQLANVLKGIITQHLIPRADGEGRIVATEIMINNNAVSNHIRENKAYMINNDIQSGFQIGMHSLQSDVQRLLQYGTVSRDYANRLLQS
ncbi:MAG: PilT/PilU family type 4a pilus ATPase [Lachnospiraceae bacterium]|nr:PilT/PilU family type 4a pilus ATPase [Candidatus Colinaster scatohippi]